jgi:hypothetical protein
MQGLLRSMRDQRDPEKCDRQCGDWKERDREMRKVAIVGIGHGKFGVRSDASLRELTFEAVKACLDDAGVPLKEVESMVTGIAGDEFSIALQPSAQVHDYIGFHPKPNFRVEGACATGSMAVRTGWMNVASGLADLVLVVGVEKMTEVPTSMATDIMGRGGCHLGISLWDDLPGLLCHDCECPWQNLGQRRAVGDGGREESPLWQSQPLCSHAEEDRSGEGHELLYRSPSLETL